MTSRARQISYATHHIMLEMAAFLGFQACVKTIHEARGWRNPSLVKSRGPTILARTKGSDNGIMEI